MQVKLRTFQAKGFDESDPLEHQFEKIIDPSRVRRFTASDDSVDRYGEVVLATGVDWGNYSKNPVVQQFHDYGMWPIGKSVAGEVRDGAILLDIEFAPASIDEEADKVLGKIDHRTVKTGSIGFLSKASIHPDGKNSQEEKDLFTKYPGVSRIFTSWELLEFSIVPVPANPNALLNALQHDAVRRFGRSPDDSGMGLPTDEAPDQSELTEDEVKALDERLARLF